MYFELHKCDVLDLMRQIHPTNGCNRMERISNHGGLKELSQQTHRFQKPTYGPNFTEKYGADKIKDLFTSLILRTIWFFFRFLNPNIFFQFELQLFGRTRSETPQRSSQKCILNQNSRPSGLNFRRFF